ncbi:MAG TPA: adenine phosphoribosyltransferase [bacterium]|nr:adenine phosphoribosyltransferase [bacterium]
MDLKALIRNVQDFPIPGVGFKDITTLIKQADAFRETVRSMCEPFKEEPPDAVAGIESRGFIFGGAMAIELGTGFIPVRKPGKLPAETVKETYRLEYGTDAVEMHRDAVGPNMRILLVDDLLATGGTAAATLRLIRSLEGIPVGAAFLVELTFLNGRQRLGNCPVHVLIQYDTE